MSDNVYIARRNDVDERTCFWLSEHFYDCAVNFYHERRQAVVHRKLSEYREQQRQFEESTNHQHHDAILSNQKDDTEHTPSASNSDAFAERTRLAETSTLTVSADFKHDNHVQAKKSTNDTNNVETKTGKERSEQRADSSEDDNADASEDNSNEDEESGEDSEDNDNKDF